MNTSDRIKGWHGFAVPDRYWERRVPVDQFTAAASRWVESLPDKLRAQAADYVQEVLDAYDSGERPVKGMDVREGVAWDAAEAMGKDVVAMILGQTGTATIDGHRFRSRRAQKRASARSDRIASGRTIVDSQKSKLYAAERAWEWWRQGEEFEDEAAAQRYVDKLTGSAWWKRRYGAQSYTVRFLGGKHNNAYARYRDNVVKLPTWARTETVLLHEMAHHACFAAYGNRWTGTEGVAAHGREYARLYVELVAHQLGKAAADALKKSFREHKVKYSLPKKLTEEQRAAAAERLVAARAARRP